MRLTVALLAFSMLLVFSGTLAQRHESLWLVQKEYFQSLFVVGDFHYLQLPLPGGYIIGGLLILNLLAAFLTRFKWSARKMGLNLLHLGILVLLVGELITGLRALETQMVLDEGTGSSWTHDVHTPELAVIDPTRDTDHEVVLDASLLRQGRLIRDQRLPIDLRIEQWFDNAFVQDPLGRRVLHEQPRAIEDISRPGALVTIMHEGRAIQTETLWFNLLQPGAEPRPVRLSLPEGDRILFIDLRPRRYYHPYRIHLHNFVHERYHGTNIPKRFASDIQLIDPERDTDRRMIIEMNHPLRYRGKTFFQASFANDDRTSILQVVENPVWTAPYIGCLLVALGMTWHFLLKLRGFLSRRGRTAAPVSTGRPAAEVSNAAGSALPPPHPLDVPAQPLGDLRPERRGRTGLLIGAALALVVIALSWWSGRLPAPEGFDLQNFAKIPVKHDGRVKPIETVARAHAVHMTHRRSIPYEEGRVGAVEWYLRMIAPRQAEPRTLEKHELLPAVRAFLADVSAQRLHPALVLETQLIPDEHRDQIMEFLLHSPDRFDPTPEDEKRIEFLAATLRPQLLAFVMASLDRRPESDAPIFRIDHQEIRGLIGAADERQKHFSFDELRPGLSQIYVSGFRAANLPRERRTLFDRKAMELYAQVMRYATIVTRQDILPIAPMAGVDEWSMTHDAPADHPSAEAWRTLARTFESGDHEAFNQEVRRYLNWLAQTPATASDSSLRELGRVNLEATFNRLDPFQWTMVLYVLAFLLGVFSWLGWSGPLRNLAVGVALVALIYHTTGLGLRVYIHGKPPVTSLYSSAVFIGWVSVLLGMILERFSRNGIALVASAVAGIGSLIVAQSLSSGDDFEAVRAVLNTPFWLTTHVLTITIGYGAMFVAGILGIIYLFGSVSTPLISHQLGLTLQRMIYGVICFAALFSFVGTLLGGIWADQSWGRFWGWDPKENGALLIVVLCAIILHARWGGMIADRGIAMLAILGNIITAWSWFGVNLMGVGLHSYGFTDSGAAALKVFALSQLGFLAIGLIPRQHWCSGIRTAALRKAEVAGKAPEVGP
ncbi:MAG: cytochrome c biogenesis protein CcsA [Phycisphaeraceae bacterium]|nr:cytochrome c biogenesis protein CcsA [Phycisphaeraceae bacterium]